MENWFEDNSFYSKEFGEKVTKGLKDDGFVSKKELDAYRFVDNLISEHIFELGIPSEMFERVIIASDVIPRKKEAKLKFYQMLGLTYVLEKALTSSKEELNQFEKDFGKQLIANSTPEELEKTLDVYEQNLKFANRRLASLWNEVEEKRQKH